MYGSNRYIECMGHLGEYITISEIKKNDNNAEYRAKETGLYFWTKEMFDI